MPTAPKPKAKPSRPKQAPEAAPKPKGKITGRPPRRPYEWNIVEPLYIYGEKKENDADTTMPVWPSFNALAVRFDIPLSTIALHAKAYDWVNRRALARAEIMGAIHQAMCRQAAENYIPIRTAAVALIGRAFTEAETNLRGENTARAEVGDRTMAMVEKGLKNLNSALGILQPPSIAIQQNNLFVQQPKPGEEPPPPSHVQGMIGANLSGSIFGQILAAREATAAIPPGLIASLEEDSTLPAHLSAVPHGR